MAVRTIWIMGDQVSPTNAALLAGDPGKDVILMIESKARGTWLRYHKLKLVLIYAAMRHYAAERRAEGWQVDYHLLARTPDFETGVRRHLEKFRPEKILLAEPNDYPTTLAVRKLARKLSVPIEEIETNAFLVRRAEFSVWAGEAGRLLMENHYRRVRKKLGILLQMNGQPVGGAWNFDRANRKTYGQFASNLEGLPRPARIEPDETTHAVMAMVEREFQDHPGETGKFWLPVTRKSALTWLDLFIKERLPRFGDFEDVMAESEPVLFHSVLSPLLNIGLLHPREVVDRAIDAYRSGAAPLNSVEGFVRQIVGWREFINGIYWHAGPAYHQLNELGATRPLPKFFYSGETRMNCLHHTIQQVRDLGWNHHIQRLMILGNFMLIAQVQPRAALRWFLEMYVDAYDWVMAANVIGMILHADGGYMATKPYAATANYINRMSNYCRHCFYDPKEKTGPTACPFNYLYWNFWDQHAQRFEKNPRVSRTITVWRSRPEREREEIRDAASKFQRNLEKGEV